MIKLATDLDGTIYKGTKLIKGVKDSYENLIDNNVEIYFITNNSSQTPYEIKEKLERLLQSEIDINKIVTPLNVLKKMFLNQTVTLADLLLMFLYLEVMAMVRVFWDQQSISITLPLLIAITALSRFIILQGKEMDPSGLVYEAVAIVLIASAIVILRLRHSDKLGLKSKKKS